MTDTHKIQIVGQIDDQKIDVTMEFASTDKAGVIKTFQTVYHARDICLTDIYGNMFIVNYEKVKYMQLRVIEIID